MFIPVFWKPNCPHATLASGAPKASSHTVPHTLLLQTSIRPSLALVPPTSLISPWVHAVNLRRNIDYFTKYFVFCYTVDSEWYIKQYNVLYRLVAITKPLNSIKEQLIVYVI